MAHLRQKMRNSGQNGMVEENSLRDDLLSKNYNSFITNLPSPLTKQKVDSILEVITQTLAEEDQLLLSVKLINQWQRPPFKIGEKLLLDLWLKNKEIVEIKLIELAKSSNWSIRETAAQVWSVLLTHRFEEMILWINLQSKSSDENIRRTSIVAIKYTVQNNKHIDLHKIFDILRPLFADKSEYVQRNLGPFVIGDGILRIYPKETIAFFEELIKNKDEQVKWNLARAFGSGGGKKHWESGIHLLHLLAQDERRYVWKAVSTTMQYLGKKLPEKILPLLQDWSHDSRTKIVAEDALKYLNK